MNELISAVIGIIVGVILEDPLTRMKDWVIHQYKKLFFKKPQHIQSSTTFSLGPIHTSWLIVDGDGEDAYTPKTIKTYFDPKALHLPDDLESNKKKIEKDSALWNGERYFLDKFFISRDASENHLGLEAWFGPTDYYTFLATNMQLDDEKLREKYVGDTDWQKPLKYFSNSFGINLAIITEDEYLIIPKRSGKVGTNKDMYNASVNEGLSRALDRGVSGQAPDFYRCAIRGISEELGIEDVVASDVVFLSLGVDTKYSQWGILGLVKVEKKVEEILAWRARGVKDKWEHTEFHTIKFDLHTVIEFIFTHPTWTPAGFTCIYQTLVHEFKRERVEKAIEKYLKSHKE